MIGGATRPQNFIARPHHGSMIPHKISDRYDSPNPFKNSVTELEFEVKMNNITKVTPTTATKKEWVPRIFFNVIYFIFGP
jgi:hypothetical protein